MFGGTRRSIEALAAQADSQRFALEATYLTLTSNLAGAAVQEASLRGQIAATQSIIKIESDMLDLLRHQRGLGAVADADVVAQEAALAQAEQTLPPLRKQLAQQRNLLAALTGGFPSQPLPQQFVLAELRLPRDLPVSLPSQLVEQRPDIRAAEANLQAASAQIGVAIANRLPNITLTATAGSTAIAVEQLFTPGNQLLEHRRRGRAADLPRRHAAASRARGEGDLRSGGCAVSQHRDHRVPERRRRAARDPGRRRRPAKGGALPNAQRPRASRLRGIVSSSATSTMSLLLNAQQTYQQALLSLVQARAARYADTVALFQALGGGWWNRSDVEPERPLTISDVLQ